MMERASKLIRGLRLPGDMISAEELACAAWAGAVGTKIAAHTRAAKLVRTHLVIEVEDAVWRRQLLSLSGQIVNNLARSLGPGLVEDLEFRVVPKRRGPQRALVVGPGDAGRPPNATGHPDEAAAIADPVLRSIYRASRKRAQA